MHDYYYSLFLKICELSEKRPPTTLKHLYEFHHNSLPKEPC
uniref:Uncharacterized protein n=1 Tax=Rhizophora mucronata TaxID=61149 RepID=A0A2P2N607_RHIMU